MRAKPSTADGDTVNFRFADITNQLDPASSYMAHLTVTFQDADRFTQKRTHVVKGKEEPMVIRWERRK